MTKPTEYMLDGDELEPLDMQLEIAEGSAQLMREEADKESDPVIKQQLLDGATEQDALAQQLQEKINENAA